MTVILNSPSLRKEVKFIDGRSNRQIDDARFQFKIAEYFGADIASKVFNEDGSVNRIKLKDLLNPSNED